MSFHFRAWDKRFTLSPQIVTWLLEKGYQLIRKIGAGAHASAFLASTTSMYDPVVVLIRAENNPPELYERIVEFYQHIKSDQEMSNLGECTARLLDILDPPYLLSNSKRYRRIAYARQYPILVLERGHFTMGHQVQKISDVIGASGLSKEVRIAVFHEFGKILEDLYNCVERFGYAYRDTNLDNIIMIGGVWKFIDLESLEAGGNSEIELTLLILAEKLGISDYQY